jgi:hypothetical protein
VTAVSEARRSAAVWRWVAAAALVLIAGGCATPPPPPPPAAPAPVVEPAPVLACPTCDEQNREVARLHQELAARDAELRDLRAQHRDQIKALQESNRQAVRAKVKLRRLASQANAASYIAEVEVALETLRSSPDAASRGTLIALPQAMLEAADVAFAQGDYGMAMDHAGQAEQMIAMLAEASARAAAARAHAEVAFEVPIPLRVKVDSRLRRQPRGNAPIVGIVSRASPVVALAYKGNWLRVRAENGRSGWIHQTLLEMR